MKIKELCLMNTTNYDDWNDGSDFRPSYDYFCEKCDFKGTFLKKAVDEETKLSYTYAQDCECKVEYIVKMRLKAAGIHPQYRSLDCKKELYKNTQAFLDTFYDSYKDENKISNNLLIWGSDQAQKTKLLALMAKYLAHKNVNLTIKYTTLHDIFLTINRVWKTSDFSEIEDLHTYDILIIDKVESGLHFIKQNMNMATFNNIFDKRDLDQKPTIISCGKTNDLDYLNLELNKFISKEIK